MEEESTMWKILNNTLSCAKIRIINSQFSWKKSKALMQKRENERKWDKKKQHTQERCIVIFVNLSINTLNFVRFFSNVMPHCIIEDLHFNNPITWPIMKENQQNHLFFSAREMAQKGCLEMFGVRMTLPVCSLTLKVHKGWREFSFSNFLKHG